MTVTHGNDYNKTTISSEFALPAYTYSLNNHFRMTAVTSYVEVDFPANEELGIPEDINESGWGGSVFGGCARR
jgi:hypothetical protein